MRSLSDCSSRIALVGLLATSVYPWAAAAQDTSSTLPLDRWLVSERLELPLSDPGSPPDPLQGPEGVAFPERDLDVGPAYWTLVREDGARGLRARSVLAVLDAVRGEGAETGGESSILAHVYLRAPEDRTVLLDAAPRDCQAARAWINGQPIELPGSPIQLRLAGGWNTLLVRLRESTDCSPDLPAAILPGIDLDKDSDAAGTLAGMKVQASRPPGVRRQHPEGWVSVGAVEAVAGLVWQAGAEDLTGTVRYDYVAWGRPRTPGGGEGDREIDEVEPPAFDVTGEWDLNLFGPMGVQRSTVEFEMSEDGALEGQVLGGDRDGGFRGRIEDGWVRGDRISFVLLFSAPRGRSMEVRLEGLVERDVISGSIDFGGVGGGRIGDFESRFEATRRPGGENPDPGQEDPVEGEGAERRDPEARPQLPGRRQGGRPGGLPGTGGQLSDDDLRARVRSRLFPPPEPTAPAPDTAAFELRLGGPRVHQVARDLVPAVPASQESSLPFKRLRELALSRNGAEIRLRWVRQERELRRAVAPERVLLALHAATTLTGWSDEGGGRYSGTWRIPEALSGFTLRLVSPADGPTFSVNGQTLTRAQANLCSPCREGERLDVVMTGATQAPGVGSGGPQVRIVEPGYPDAGAEAAPATEWLEALRGDNRRYRELAALHAGG